MCRAGWTVVTEVKGVRKLPSFPHPDLKTDSQVTKESGRSRRGQAARTVAASFSPPIGEAHLPPRNRLAALVTSVGSASGTCVTWARAWCASCGQLVSKVRGEGLSSFGETLVGGARAGRPGP